MQKLTFSELQSSKSDRQITIEKMCDLTGLPHQICADKYDQMIFDYSEDEIISQLKEQQSIEIGKIYQQNKLIQDLKEYQFGKLNESQHQQFYLDNFKSINDPYSKLHVVKELLQKTNQNDVEDMQPLFEGIQHEMAQINKFYTPDGQTENMFDIIMSNVNRIVQDNELKKVMIADDNAYYYNIIRAIFSGGNDGFYNNISTIRQVIEDKQTLTFDLVLFVHKYIKGKEYDLSFINPKTVREYNNTANALIENIYSSVSSSRIVNQEYVRSLRNEIGDNPHTVIEQTVGKLDEEVFIRMGVDLYNIPYKSVRDSLSLIDSLKHEFKQPISRRLIAQYYTKASQLVSDVDKAHRARIMAGY